MPARRLPAGTPAQIILVARRRQLFAVRLRRRTAVRNRITAVRQRENAKRRWSEKPTHPKPLHPPPKTGQKKIRPRSARKNQSGNPNPKTRDARTKRYLPNRNTPLQGERPHTGQDPRSRRRPQGHGQERTLQTALSHQRSSLVRGHAGGTRKQPGPAPGPLSPEIKDGCPGQS